jgi:hypothetical protein
MNNKIDIEKLNKEFFEDYKKQKKTDKKLKELYGTKSVSKYIDKYLKNEDHKINILPIKYARNNVLEIDVTKYDKYNKKYYDVQEIQEIVNKLSHKFHKNGIDGLMTIAMKYTNSWRNGVNSMIGGNINIYNPAEHEYNHDVHLKPQSKFSNFKIYVMETNKIIKPRKRFNKPQGGADIYNKNDCLFYCFRDILRDKNPFETAVALKKYLKLTFNSKVPLVKLPELENKLKMGLNVSGDFELVSSYNSKKQIYLKLINEHYSIDYDKNRKIPKNLNSFTEKQILLHDKEEKIAFDGDNILNDNEYSYNDIIHFKSKYILVSRSNYEITIQEEYKELIENITKLKEASNGLINMFKTGSIKNTVLDLFEKLTRYIPAAEHITYEEMLFIQNSTTGALIFAEPYEGPGYKYDVKSRYPSIMCSNFLIPIKAGKFETWDLEEFKKYNEWVPTGIYRCIVKKSGNKNVDRLFRFNQKNYYTSNAIKHAMFLKLEIELIIAENNVLLYPRDYCMCSNEIFKDYVMLLYDLKQKNIKLAKDILNRLWGVLTESNEQRIILNKNDSKVKNYAQRDVSIVKIKPSINKDEVIIDICDNDNYYKSGFARLKPFLLDKVKYWMTTLVHDYKDNLKRFHTDGFITDIKLDVKTGEELGNLCYEGYYEHCIIKNCSKEEGEFIKNH